MSIPIPLDRVVEIVRKIVDGIRCPICDKTEASRVRFACGHAACNDCVTVADGCVLCLTPPSGIGNNKHRVDIPFTERVKSACNLLNVCQDTFNIDVYKRIRLSEQLKVEKELFPECIQAPEKYYNKRKSHPLTRNKENISIFPGEIVSPPKKVKMIKSKHFVQEWLESSKNYNRKALTDLNVNRQEYRNKENIKMSSNKRKRKIFPSTRKEKTIRSKVNLKSNIVKNVNSFKNIGQKMSVHEESGIVLDDETIFIEDSQELLLDKDRLALLAVEAAERDFEKGVALKSKPQPTNYKVPFYVRGSLLNNFCCVNNSTNYDISSIKESNDISISIENKDFITTINISNNIKSNQIRRSTCIQTEISDVMIQTDKEKNIHVTKREESPINRISNSRNEAGSITSPSLLPETLCNHSQTKYEQRNIFKANEILSNNNVIINDSDSDSLFEESSVLQISADIHMSSEKKGNDILNELCSMDTAGRSRNKVWRVSPDSNNSSDKENCDPNKRKKQKLKSNGKYNKQKK